MSTKTLDDLDLSADDRTRLRAFLRSWDGHPKPVLFAGAGLSAFNAERKVGVPDSVKLKTWEELRLDFIDGLAGDDVNGRTALLSRDVLHLAELYESNRSRDELLDLMKRAIPYEHFDPGHVHRLLISFPWAEIITTNYDDLIERAVERASGFRCIKIVNAPDLRSRRNDNDMVIVKMHGDFKDRDSIIITRKDYRRWENTRQLIADKVRTTLSQHPLLFVGCSLSDPNVVRLLGWVHDIIGKLEPSSIAVVHDEPLGPDQHLWEEQGIHLVYCKHEVGLNSLLDALHREHKATPRPFESRYQKRDATPLPPEPDRSPRLDELSRKIRQELTERPSGWQERIRDALLELIDLATSEPDQQEYIYHAVRFYNSPIRLDDRVGLVPVIEAFDHGQFTRFMSFAERAGVSWFQPKNEIAVDVRLGLLCFGALDVDARACLLLSWCQDLRPIAELNERMLRSMTAALREIRAEVNARDLRIDLDLELREILVRLMDADGLAAELTRPREGDEAEDLCRRGADYLLLGDQEKARDCYRTGAGKLRVRNLANCNRPPTQSALPQALE